MRPVTVRGESLASTETVPAPAGQGAIRVHTGSMRPNRNAVRRDAGAVECRDDFCHGLLTLLPSRGLYFWFGLLLTALSLPACSGPQRISGIDAEVTTAGSVEITAELLEIPGKFPSNDLYDYAYILKYQVREVHRGHVVSKNILVAHYNPLKARSEAENEFSGKVGGTVRRFKEGDLHRLALEEPLDDYYMGGVIDKFEEDGTRYWSVWANLVTE